MSRQRIANLVPWVLALAAAAVAVFGAWRLVEGLSVVLGWGGLALAIAITFGVLIAAWFAVRRTLLPRRGRSAPDGMPSRVDTAPRAGDERQP